MKKLCYCLFLLFTMAFSLNAQNNIWSELNGSQNPFNVYHSIGQITTDVIGNLIVNCSDTLFKWNGTSWIKICGVKSLNNAIWTICTDNSGNVYAAGNLTDSTGNRYVARWNGTDWSILGKDTNALNANNSIRTICTDLQGNVYAAGFFKDSLGYYYVAKWNGIKWVELGTDTNSLNANDIIFSICTDSLGNVYAAGKFTNNNGYYYVAKWDGIKWRELLGGTNSLDANGRIISICYSSSGNLYASGFFTNTTGSHFVAKWNGFVWSELGNGINGLNANNTINTICADRYENIYASGLFTNSFGKYYIAKWNGTNWVDFGNNISVINQNTNIYYICSDILGNIYAGNNYTDISGKNFVAKWTNPVPSKNSSALTITNKDSTSFKVSFTKGNGMKRLVICGTSPLASLPVDSFSYGANSVLKTGYQFGADNWVVYNDTGTSVSIKGLDVCTKYYVSVIEYNYDSTHTWYMRYQYLRGFDSTTFHHVLKINTATGDTSFCNTPSIKITGNNYTDATYQWYKNSVVINGAANYVDTTVTVSGIYSLKISKNNCTLNSNNLNISLSPKPNVGFTINNSSQCLIGNSFSFDDTTSTTSSRIWNLGVLTTNTNDTFSKSYTAVGNYNVKLKITDGNNCTDSVIKVITVKANPIKPTVSAISKSQLQSTVASGYQWYLNTSAITGATLQILIITTNGNYTVKADSTNGCSNLSDPFAAGAVGIEQVYSSNEINIYPNPNTGTFTINFNNTEGEKHFAIYNLQCKLVAHYTTTESVFEVQEMLAHGMYFIKAETQQGLFNTKFVVE